jgi:hypothetical protein
VIPPISGGNGSGHFKCPAGLYSNPQCCSVGVLGLADLDCAVRKFSTLYAYTKPVSSRGP